jgi:predicted lipid carrier protein YhbT
MPAKSRNTAIATLLENFLDEHEDDLPRAMFVKLEDLAESIDKGAEELEGNIQSLESEKQDLINDFDELENRMNKLEEN